MLIKIMIELINNEFNSLFVSSIVKVEAKTSTLSDDTRWKIYSACFVVGCILCLCVLGYYGFSPSSSTHPDASSSVTREPIDTSYYDYESISPEITDDGAGVFPRFSELPAFGAPLADASDLVSEVVTKL